MLPRLRRLRLCLATARTARTAHQLRARRDQAHRCRNRVRPRIALLLPVVAAAGLMLALRPGDITRALPPWTWAPLPATAFGSLPSLSQPTAGTSQDDRLDGPALWTMPVSPTAPAAPAVRGSSGGPTVPPAPRTDRAGRDDTTVSASFSDADSKAAGSGGPDIPSVTAPVLPAPAPVRAPKGPTHVVASGDNLWTIARRHSADLASVLRWNEGVDPDRLVAGQSILVPGGSKMAPLPRPARVQARPASVRPAPVERRPAPQVQDGDHIWPLPVRGTLTRRFSSGHPGIDIAAPQGTRVRAIAGGTVVWSGWMDNGGGYVVEIEHPGGMRSTYNHNSKVTVERGDEVAQGDTIALVGSTGRSTGPHLDLRIRMGGRLVDPLDIY